jgi:hypothetical protein
MPQSATWPQIPELMPRWSYFRSPDWDQQYRAQLERYGPQRLAQRIADIGRYGFAEPADAIILLCWESKEPVSCHRLVFASWWMETTGELIGELDAAEVAPPEPEALF